MENLSSMQVAEWADGWAPVLGGVVTLGLEEVEMEVVAGSGLVDLGAGARQLGRLARFLGRDWRSEGQANEQ